MCEELLPFSLVPGAAGIHRDSHYHPFISTNNLHTRSFHPRQLFCPSHRRTITPTCPLRQSQTTPAEGLTLTHRCRGAQSSAGRVFFFFTVCYIGNDLHEGKVFIVLNMFQGVLVWPVVLSLFLRQESVRSGVRLVQVLVEVLLFGPGFVCLLVLMSPASILSCNLISPDPLLSRVDYLFSPQQLLVFAFLVLL